jgi:purine-nucleoside phosphorylase
MLEKIKNTASYIRKKIDSEPEVGVILGTGLGGMVNDIDIRVTIDYTEIPDFPVSTVEGHHGRLIYGTLGGKKILAMQGRFHYYEGYEMDQVTYPVRVMKMLGIKNLIVSNASGGVNPAFEIGDLMILDDHINLLPNPLIGKNIDELGPRIVDMSEPYDHNLIARAEEIAREHNIKVQKGCYVATSGPTLETPKEYQYFRIIGGDAVGMSTVPEVIVARHMEIPVFAVSIITDLGVPGKIEKISHDDVQRAAEKVEPQMTALMEKLIATL